MKNGLLFPFQMNLLKVKRILPQKHDGLTILFVIQGSVELIVNGASLSLLPDDIYVVNPTEEYQLLSEENNLLLNLQISRGQIESYLKKAWYPRFVCYSDVGSNSLEKAQQFQKMREIMVHLMVSYFKENPEYEFEVNQYLFSLLAYLVKEFQEASGLSDIVIKHIADEKIQRIVELINQNYNQPLSLERLAQDEFISYSHLSRSFKKSLGVTFTDYVNQVRLMHAADELKMTKHSVIKIALNNGFANAKIFHKVFRKKFGETPMSYRKIHEAQNQAVETIEETSLYTEKNGEQALQELSKYLVEKDIDDENTIIKEVNQFQLNPEYQSNYQKTKKIINIGPVIEGNASCVQKELIRLQADLKFDLIQFSGFFPETDVDAPNRILSDFIVNNRWFDFLQEMKLIPIIQLKLPKEIQSVPEAQQWCLQQLHIIRHFVNRYGYQTVSSWYFEWIPENKGRSKLYQEAYLFFCKELKEILPASNVGFLAMTSLVRTETEQMLRYFEILQDQACFPDFLTFQADPTILSSTIKNSSKNKIDFKNYHKNSLNQIKEGMKKYDFPEIEVFMTDWNTLVGEGDTLAGTFFRSALILEVMLDLSTDVAGIGFWLNVKIKERLTEKRQDHCLSVFMYDELRRPLYFAILFLNKLGNEKLEAGHGYLITRNAEEIQMLVYNPCYLMPLYSVNNFLVQNQTKHWTIYLNGLMTGDYLVRHYTLDKDHGGIYNDWLRIGGYKELDQELLKYLEQKIVPKFELLKEPVVAGSYQFTTNLTINACQLYCFKPLL